MDKNNTRKSLFIIIKAALAVLFVISSIIIAIYRVPNQNVRVYIDTRAGAVDKVFSAEEIGNTSQFEIAIPGIVPEDISEVRLYRHFKTICLDKIKGVDLSFYSIYENEHLFFNEQFTSKINAVSKSYLTERLFYIEVMLAGIMLLWIIVNALEEKFDPANHDNHGPIHEIKKFISDIKNYGQYMVYAARADLNAEVANSYLNRLWWLLEPMFNMIVYVVVFGRVMGNSVENYATFVFASLLMWNYFSKAISYSVKCVRNNRDIVTKIYVPKHILLLTDMILNFFKLLFSAIILVVMLVVFRVQLGVCIWTLIPSYLLMFLLAFGGGMIFLHYGVYIDDLGYAVGILLQILMFLSGIFYDTLTSLSTPLNVMMLSVNPVAMFIDTMRNGLLYNTVANVPLWTIWIVLSLQLCYIGIHIVYKNENGYVKVV